MARFLVRKGTEGWMVWDRLTRATAIIDFQFADGLTEDQARDVMAELTKRDGAGQHAFLRISAPSVTTS